MISFNLFKHRLVALVVALITSGFCSFAYAEETAAQEHGEHAAGHAQEEKKGFNAKEVILGHVKDAHDWHLLDIAGTPVTMPLPVIVYSKVKGLTVFSSSHFHHGHVAYEGYRLINHHYLEEKGLEPGKYMEGKIIAVDANDMPTGEEIYDFSMTKNITSMLIGAILLVWLMLAVAGSYIRGGSKTAPKGLQGIIEPVIIFMRDEVVKPNIPRKHFERYTPFILTIFFFILINNLLGLLPGSANVTGNLAVTAALALISFLATLFSSNKHFWSHTLNPPDVPFLVKVILVPVEIIGIFTKPVSLMIRLFANILAGHIIILSIISLVFIFGSLNQMVGYGFLPITILFNIVMMMLELLVAFIQAFIFANLTAVFIGQVMEGGHDDHHEAKAHH